MITEHGLIISAQKTKLWHLKDEIQLEVKLLTNNKMIEQVNSFNYLGNLIRKKWTLIPN